MPRFCPFMNDASSIFTSNRVPCQDTCALYHKGFCSFSILAQKAEVDYKREKKETKSEE